MALLTNLINSERYSKYYHRLGVIYQRPDIKASLEVILSVFMISMLIFLAIRPTITNIAALQKKIQDEEAVNVKADKKITQLFTASDQLAANSALLGLYDKAVASKFSYLDILGRVEKLARSAGLEITNLSLPGTDLIGQGKAVGSWAAKIIKSDNSGIKTMALNFQVAGKPIQIRNFLVEVERMDRLAIIKNLELAKEVGTIKGSERVKASGQINFYFYLPTVIK